MCDFEHKLNQLAALVTRVNILEQNLSTTFTAIVKPIHDNGLSEEDLIKFVVQDELNMNMKTEEKDFASRQNVIFHRVPEKRSDKVEEGKDSDLICVTELDGVFNIKLQENVE